MSLSDLASLGSFVSGVAVVFSFLFLTLQLRQANRNQRALMQQGRSARTIETLSYLSDPHIFPALSRGMAGDPTLPPDQIGVLLTATYMLNVNFEDSFLQFKAGTLDSEIWEVEKTRLTDLFKYPGYRATWQVQRKRFGKIFESLVDDMIRQVRSAQLPDEIEAWKSFVADEIAGPSQSHSTQPRG